MSLSQPSHTPVAAQCGELCSLLSPCNSSGAPHSPFDELHPGILPSIPISIPSRCLCSPGLWALWSLLPTPALNLLFLLGRCRRWCPALPCTSPS